MAGERLGLDPDAPGQRELLLSLAAKSIPPGTLHLRSLGRTVARLTASPDGAELQTIDGKREKAESLEVLLDDVLHVQLPARELPLWMLGLTNGASAVHRDAQGLPETLSRGAWDIHYLRYAAVGGLQMPSLLQADGPDGVRLRLAVTRWQLGADS